MACDRGVPPADLASGLLFFVTVQIWWAAPNHVPVWKCEDTSQRFDDFVGLALYVEYTNDSANLLVFTNHHSRWMNQILSDANVLGFAKPLKRQEIYPGI